MDIYVDNSGLKTKIRYARYIATCTQKNADFLRDKYPDYREKIVTVYHGISKQSPAQTEVKHRPFTFLAVGRFVPKKGFRYLLEACLHLKERQSHFKCQIVGEGPLKEKPRITTKYRLS